MSLNDWDIRQRAVFGAVLPTMVMAVVLVGYFTTTRLTDLEEAHQQRGKALTRQLAAASAYIVFAGDHEALRRLAASILQESDVVRVTITGPGQELLTDLRRPPMATGTLRLPTSGTPLRLREAVSTAGNVIDDPFLGESASLSSTGGAEVLVEMSRDSLHAEELRLFRNAVMLVMTVLLASILLAARLSRGVSGPILRIAATVTRFGKGDRSARCAVEGGRSLRALAQGVNDMADRLSSSSESLERQIEAATRELKAKKDEAEHSNRAKTRFLAAASHDLRQPMHALGLFIAELGQKEHTPDSARLVEHIATSAENMENLLDSLLDISRLDAGVLDRQIKSFPLQGLLDRIEVDYHHDARQRGLRLRLRPTRLWVRSDPLLIERILHNLISNALRYTLHGTVLLACRPSGDAVRIEVRDSGPGIALDAQEVIFQEFVQLDNPERNRAKGLGLGLAIVRRLTDLLEHRLILRSAPGRGALFAIELPRSALGADAADEATPAAHSLADIHVLLIDDDPVAMADTCALLQSWECLVTTLENPEQLLRWAPGGFGRAPNILLCDLHRDSPERSILCIDRLRHFFDKDIAAILLSTDTSPATTQQVQEAGVHLLQKPVRPARLRALMQRKASADAARQHIS